MSILMSTMERWLFNCYRKVAENIKYQRATILNFHRVLEQNEQLDIDYNVMSKDEFYLKMKLLKQHFNVLPLPELIALSQEQKLPPLAVGISVDDGYEDGYSTITPILDSLGLSGAFFITTNGIEDGQLWNDKIFNAIHRTNCKSLQGFLDIPELPLTTSEEKASVQKLIHQLCKYMTLEKRENAINELIDILSVDITDKKFLTAPHIQAMRSAGMIIGAHTHNHPILALETPETALVEIETPKVILENIIGESIDYFAYPNGKYIEDFNDKHISMLKQCGYKAALSTNWGSLEQNSDVFNIPRFTPWDKNAIRFGIRLCRHIHKK